MVWDDITGANERAPWQAPAGYSCEVSLHKVRRLHTRAALCSSHQKGFPIHVWMHGMGHAGARTSSLSPKASSAVTVQSRYSWIVAILGASTKDVFRPLGGRVCK